MRAFSDYVVSLVSGIELNQVMLRSAMSNPENSPTSSHEEIIAVLSILLLNTLLLLHIPRSLTLINSCNSAKCIVFLFQSSDQIQPSLVNLRPRCPRSRDLHQMIPPPKCCNSIQEGRHNDKEDIGHIQHCEYI